MGSTDGVSGLLELAVEDWPNVISQSSDSSAGPAESPV